MSAGVALFFGILLSFAVLGAAQWWLARRAMALEGEPVPPLPASHAHLASEDALLWFHSPTCGPCKAMHPFVDALEAQGRAHSIDVSRHLDVAAAFGVMATPTTVRLSGGRVLEVRTGGLGPQALEGMLGPSRQAPSGQALPPQ